MLKTILVAVVFSAVIYLADGIFVKPTVTSSIGKCYQNPEDFVNYCTSILHGITDGNRCYFFSDTNKDWATGWASCQQYGAVIAQIHTAMEYGKIGNYAFETFGASVGNWSDVNIVLLGMRDDIGSNGFCRLTPTTFFYDSETAITPGLLIMQTWLYRQHRCDANDVDDPVADLTDRYLCLFRGSSGQFIIVDASNGPRYAPLCQISNLAQKYVMTTPPTCMDEYPVKSMPVSVVEECAQECSSSGWCRSFNVIVPTIGSSKQCQFFSWSILDTNKTRIDSTCFHYNYAA